MRHAILIAALATSPASAQGFATRDLTTVEPAMTTALGEGYIGRAEPEQLLFTCPTCDGEPTIAVIIGRQTDGTEGRVRTGKTSIADLQKLCQARSPDCTLTALTVDPAVGWVTSYTIGSTAGATAVVIRDGDLLTIRSVATNPAAARRSIDRLLPLVRAKIVG